MELKELIKYARDNRCSDLHITAGEAVAVRKYGELELLDITPSIEETEDMIFSILGDEDIQNVQAGKDIDVASTDESGGRLRINIYHQRRNLAASIRLLDSVIPSFEELGHSGKLFSKLVEKRSGLILVTGPTGSGKSTTLAAMIDYINNNMSRHIITVEDPIEYVYGFKKSMIHQRQVGRDVPDFATALRSALREDPDVILVGEMRDYETINAAITAASFRAGTARPCARPLPSPKSASEARRFPLSAPRSRKCSCNTARPAGRWRRCRCGSGTESSPRPFRQTSPRL